MNTNDWNETIDAYLAGKLSGAEKQSFEQAVATNTDLAMELEIFRLENTAKELLIEEDLRKQMDEWESSMPPTSDQTPEKKNGRNGYRWGVLGLLLVVAGLAAWWFVSKPSTPDMTKLPARQPTLRTEEYVPPKSGGPVANDETKPTDNQTPKEEQNRIPKSNSRELLAMADELYDPYDASGVRGEGDDTTSIIQKAAAAYTAKDFKKVVALLQTPSEDDRTEALKLRAHAHFQLKSYSKAAADFKELTSSFSYKYDAQWNLLLSYLALSPQRQADFDTLLKEITGNADHPFNTPAKALQNRIKK